MSSQKAREHFIPVSVEDLIHLLGEDRGPTGLSPLSDDEKALFEAFAHAADSNIHARYLDQLKELKTEYAPFDPDSDVKRLRELSDEVRAEKLDNLIDAFAHLLEKANYIRLSKDQLEQVMKGASDWGVDMSVDWDAFEKVDVFVRGRGFGTRTRRRWYKRFRLEEVTIPTFSRVVLILKQKAHPRLGADADTRNVYLKLFKDIPQMDVEMLLPGTKLKMPLFDRLKLGGTGASSVGYVAYKLSSLSFAGLAGAFVGGAGVLGLLTLYTPLALIFGYAYKTYASFMTTKQTYMLQLSQSLYYQNLDNNAGVLYRLLDMAEEQESREVILGYFYLWRYAGEQGWTQLDLDQYIELDLERRLGLEVDFEIGDSLEKLLMSGCIEQIGDRYRAISIRDAMDRLDDVWEKYAKAADAIDEQPVEVASAKTVLELN